MKPKIRKINLLRKANPRVFARLCEEAGLLEDALKFYSTSNIPGEIYRAAEIAYKLENYGLAREMLDRSLKQSEADLKRARYAAENPEPHDRSGMGVAMAFAGTEKENKEMRERVSEMERKIVDAERKKADAARMGPSDDEHHYHVYNETCE